MPIAHVTFGTTDIARGAAFYDAVMEAFGGTRAFTRDTAIGWAFADGGPSLGICLPFDGEPASCGNGTMFALMASNETQVRQVHAAALAGGGSDEGAPGIRANGFYAAYFRDPDGNKLNAFCIPLPA